MRRKVGSLVIAAAAAAGCSSSADPTGSLPATERPTSTSAAVPSAAGGLVPVPGGFEIDRVRLMEAADLPDGIPVPVPFGGTIDEGVSISEGQSLIVHYDPRFLATAAAFYQTWFQQEGIDARLRDRFSNDGVSWDAVIDGQDVQVRLTLADDGTASTLIVLWP